jgi:division protein CdvB (Snf7/Vps24/ESCRT-III family)
MRVADGETAMIKVTGSLQKSTEIMKLSNSLIKLPQISAVMREMSMEMTKVSISPSVSMWSSYGYRLESWRK